MSEPSAEYTLHGHVRSGNAYKPALMLALTGTPFNLRVVDLPGGEQSGDAYRKQSLFATVPMLEHRGMERLGERATIFEAVAPRDHRLQRGEARQGQPYDRARP